METFKLSNEEWLEISRDLESHHSLFYQCWQMGRPCFDESIKTACVAFDKEGEFIKFMFNPHFWRKLNNYNRLFVICHECLHVILNHGIRTKDADPTNSLAINITLDVVVNEMLINNFGFDRDKIDIKDICWVNTVFENHPKKNKIPTDESFEFYYSMLPTTKISLSPLDDHSLLNENESNQIIEKLDNLLTNEEKSGIKPILESSVAGDGTGSWTFVDLKNVPKKKKWETIVQVWTKKYLREIDEENEQWATLHRRLSIISGDLFLPSEMEELQYEADKLPLFLFIDTSGSCWGHKERFINLAMSIPNRFIVRTFAFDTEVHEIDLSTGKSNGRVSFYGGGGTSFSILEKNIQDKIKEEGIKYPQGVFVLTDGYGDYLSPMYPERWHWILTPYNTRTCIPQKSRAYEMSQFE